MMELTFLPSPGNSLVHKEFRRTGLEIQNHSDGFFTSPVGLRNPSQQGRILPLAVCCIDMFLRANNYIRDTRFSLKPI